MEYISKINQYSATMSERIRKINDSGCILSADQIDEYEFDLLQFANEIAVEEHTINYKLIRFDLQRAELYAVYRPESKSNADAEGKVDAELAGEKSNLKEKENTIKLYKSLMQNYKRRGDRLTSRSIYDMSQEKRINTNSNNMPF